jgi:hypothetical protein
MRQPNSGLFWLTPLCAAVLGGLFAPRSDAQVGTARRALVKVEVVD